MEQQHKTFRPIQFEWMKEELRKDGYIAEFPSNSSIYHGSHEKAYGMEDVIHAFAYCDLSTGAPYLKLESKKFTQTKFLPLPVRDPLDTKYGQEFEDADFLKKEVYFFDDELDELARLTN